MRALGLIEGDGAPKSANLWCPRSCETATGAYRRANHGVHTAPGLALVRSVTLECADRSFRWLPAGPPIGSGRSSGTARALMLRTRARRRRTSSRFTNALEKRPSSGRDHAMIRAIRPAGISSQDV